MIRREAICRPEFEIVRFGKLLTNELDACLQDNIPQRIIKGTVWEEVGIKGSQYGFRLTSDWGRGRHYASGLWQGGFEKEFRDFFKEGETWAE